MTERMKGYLILLLSLFIFTIWGVNLFSLSEIEVQTPDPDGTPKAKSPASAGATTIKHVTIRPRPFLYYYLLRLGYNIIFSEDVPEGTTELMIIFDPPRRMRGTIQNNLMPWVRSGGNLILFFSEQHSIATYLGADVEQPLAECEENPASPLPFMGEVSETASSRASLQPRRGASFFPLMVNEAGQSTVMATCRGQGQMFLISNAELFYPDGLKKEDNIVFITRLVENLTADMTVYMYSPEPEFAIKTTVRSSRNAAGTMKTKTKKVKYTSLWSLIKANPISWVLAQLFFGLAVYFYALSRRFSRPLPLPESGYSVDTYISGMSRLYREMKPTSFAAERLLFTFLGSFRKRVGLPAEEDDREIFTRIESTHPHLVINLRAAIRGLEKIIKDERKNPTLLLRYARILEAARKELKIHG